MSVVEEVGVDGESVIEKCVPEDVNLKLICSLQMLVFLL